MVETRALSLGYALDADSAGSGAIHSVFARALNFEIGSELWTLVGADRADLPFGIRVASPDFDALGLRRGDRVAVRAGRAGFGSGPTRLLIDCRTAPRWIPACPDELAPGLVSRLGVVATAADDRAWHGSPRMARAVMVALNDSHALGEVLPDVIGCGPGATPAGDDVLVGILAVLTSSLSGVAGAAAAESLCRSIFPLLSTTTDISGHLLRQAAQGLFGRSAHELVAALIAEPAPERLRETVRRAVETGATSGGDTCVGILAAAPAFLPTREARPAA